MSPVAKKSARKVEVTLTQVESVSAAVKFLTGRGYKVSRSSFVSHLKAGLIAQDSRGCFKVKDLLAYAAVKLPPPLTEKTGAGLDLAQAKLREDTESRRLQNERARLKLELEQGRLIARDQVGRELAARIAFFKRELETLWVLTGPKVLALLKGDPAKLPDLNSWWKKTVAEWMDIWSQDRSYADESEPEPKAAGPLGKAGGRAKPLTGPSGGTVPERNLKG